MEDIVLTYRQVYLVAIIGGAIVGALLGLVPLILGRRHGKGRMGWYGLIASAVAGGISVLIALIVTGIFSWLIIRKTQPSAATSSDSEQEDQPSE